VNGHTCCRKDLHAQTASSKEGGGQLYAKDSVD